MKNKYDIEITENEAKELANNVGKIADFCKDLVKYYGTTASLNVEWSFYDKVWGKRACSIEIYRYKSVKGACFNEWFSKVEGQYGNTHFNFDELTDTKELLSSCRNREYALSLLDNWKWVKRELEEQDKQRSETRQLIKDFEL